LRKVYTYPGCKCEAICVRTVWMHISTNSRDS
jgi:hypothetical protein